MNLEKAQEYLQQHGVVCPFCGTADIEGGPMNFDWGEIAQEVFCRECGEIWTDIYKLAAVADADSGELVASILIEAE